MPRGFQGVRQASAEVEARRANAGGGGFGALWFRLKDGEEAIVRFLEQDEDVAWTNVHRVSVEGQQYDRDVLCLNQSDDGTPCPGCERQIPRKFKGFINLIWYDAPVFKKSSDNKTVKDAQNNPIVIEHKPQVAVWNSGIRVFEELDETNANYRGLRSRLFRIKRKGSGLDTRYSISPADVDGGPQEFTPQEKELEKKKYDLSLLTKPGTYDEFLKSLGEVVTPNGTSTDQPRTNPFMRRD